MNGKVETTEKQVEYICVLSYTHYAPPLTLGKVKEDLDDAYLEEKQIDKIVMWGHQLDWIIKNIPSEYHGAPPSASLTSGTSLWGIPLAVLK